MLKPFNEVVLRAEFKSKDARVRNKNKEPEFSARHVISHTPSKHLVVRQHDTDKSKRIVRYSAYNPRTKKIDMTVNGKEIKHPNGHRTLQIKKLAGREGGEIKAHDFYHHLITKHKVILQSDQQSEGGMKVWQRLKKHHPDVHVHGWIPRDVDKIGSKTGEGKHVRQISRNFTHVPYKTSQIDTSNMNLVAASSSRNHK
jgi:hypothetical protein